MGRSTLLIFLTAVATCCALAQQSDPSRNAAGIQFFESNIRPVLVKSCYQCHSAGKQAALGGLYLDTRDGVRKGGSSGPAIVPGKPDESLLMKAIRHDGRKMPPTGMLPDSVIGDFEKWIAMGAPDPREGTANWKPSNIDIEKGRKFWAFQPVTSPDVPKVKNVKWPGGAIDHFLLARMEQKGLAPVIDADRATWLRRVTLDLTGLPPTPAELDAFSTDRRSSAYSRVVDRLLASERFGERWGRHWLDIARYAESVGRGRNYAFPYAWRYRNYVIASFNDGKPYDQFIREQIAGDLLPADSPKEKREQLTATGFLTLGSNDTTELNATVYRMEIVDEQINATTRAFQALTVGCARCHDHKFDPIPTTDYYAMAGIFSSSEMLSGLQRRPRDAASYFNLNLLAKLNYGPHEAKPQHFTDPADAKRWDDLQGAHRQMLIDIEKMTGEALGLRRLQAGLKVLREIDKLPLPPDLVMAVREGQIADCKVNIGGDPKKLGPAVPRGFIQVVSRPGEKPSIGARESGRLQLADWIARRENPLTARVAVNRIWQQMFGRGLVATVDNFGAAGEKPTHPELLDYLATRFMDQGWSVKKIIREIALSRAYRLSSTYESRNAEADPENTLVWRMNRRRLEAEALRDSILWVSGQIDLKPPAESPVFGFKRQHDVGGKHGTMPDDYSVTLPYRSVYVPVLRTFIPGMFEVFDFPEPSETKGRREVTTVPTQALFLMNSSFVMEQSKHAANKLLSHRPATTIQRVKTAYRETLGRAPDSEELRLSAAFVRAAAAGNTETDRTGAERTAWARLYQALFASAEFRYRN